MLYDGFWWVGMVHEIDNEQNDVKVKFMHPYGATRISIGRLERTVAGNYMITSYTKLKHQLLALVESVAARKKFCWWGTEKKVKA